MTLYELFTIFPGNRPCIILKQINLNFTAGFQKTQMRIPNVLNPLYLRIGTEILFSDDGLTMAIPLVNKFSICVGYAKADTADAHLLLHLSFSKASYARASQDCRSMHYLIMGQGPADKPYIDHINGDRYDNRRCNLRFVTASQNAQNARNKKANATSKYLGVSRNNPGNGRLNADKWRAGIHTKGTSYNLGIFDTELEAAKMYDVWAVHFHEEGALTNGTLTDVEKAKIVEFGIPPEFMKPSRATRDLPENISFNHYPNKKYRFRKSHGGKDNAKNFYTVAEAVAYKEKMLAKWAAEDNEAELERQNNVTRNAYGDAFVACRKGDNVYQYLVDDWIWPEVSKYTWGLSKTNYAHGTVAKRHFMLHNYIFKLVGREIPKHMTVDHINGFKWDNRLCNLRLAEPRLQSHNRGKYGNTLDRFKGVSFTGHSYMVVIEDTVYGYYECEEDAARRANELYIGLYGGQARLNVVPNTVTTKDNRLPREMITREYIENITYMKEMKHLIRILKLNEGNGGPYNFEKIKGCHLETIREQILSNEFQYIIGLNF
jgi:hypothetical protein